MKPRRDRRLLIALPLCLVAALLAVWTLRGPFVAGGMLAGLIGTAGYLGGTWIGIRLATREGVELPTGAKALAAVLLLKLPPIVLLAMAARNAPAPVRDGLLYGGAVVYFFLVSWGVLPKRPAAPKGL